MKVFSAAEFTQNTEQNDHLEMGGGALMRGPRGPCPQNFGWGTMHLAIGLYIR